jgi:GT2 family glycosyltransferase
VPSVIVPARNGFEQTSICLASLLFSLTRLNLKCEFILVDDASDEPERIQEVFQNHRASAKGHETKIIRSRKHQHYSRVFSIGLNYATRDVVFFISNDMVITPYFLQALLVASSLSREFGIVRGTSNYVDSHPEHIVRPQEILKDYRGVENFSQRVFGAQTCTTVEDSILSGDAILIKRELIDKIGVLDMRYFGYFGDVDYGMRTHLAGFKLICAKGAWLLHEGGGYVKREMQRDGIVLDQARDKRLALVEDAYREFRSKWHIEQPALWEGGIHAASLDFNKLAREHAEHVPLRYEFPITVMDDLEIL